MNFDILRQKILEKAIRGELVPQLESEPEVAQIGKTPNNVPFVIPKKWKWNQLLDIFYVYQPKTISMKELSDSGDYFVYGANGIIGRYTNYNHENSEVVIACRGATCGAVNVTLPKSWINGNAMVVKPRNDLVCHDYLVAFLKVFNWKKVISGSAQPQITRKNLATVLFPLPPLEEQHRIVAKLNQLCDQIESAENAYKELSDSLSERFKQLCLEKVVQGKLVPQLESEPETDRTISSVKEAPFKIPEKWQWCKLSDALEIQNGDRGKNYPSKSKLTDNNTGLPFVSALNLESFKISHKNLLYLYPEQYEKLRSGHIKINDCLLCIRGSLGKFGFATQSGGAIASSLVILRSKDDSFVSPKYLKIFLQSLFFKEQINLRQNGTAQPNLSAKDLSNFLIPIPPVAEQRRIASKFEEICKIMKII